jgi:GNAT superfamily N-acetyltransferase
MSVRLRPLREDEFPALVEEGRRQYARDMIENGGFSPDAAERKAAHDWATTLPEGLGTEDHWIFAVEEAESGRTVGRVWFARRQVNGVDTAFLYDIHLDETVRGRGFGRQAMQLLEQEVRSRGLSTIALNVFGGNSVARALYASLGYRESYVGMRKDLSA